MQWWARHAGYCRRQLAHIGQPSLDRGARPVLAPELEAHIKNQEAQGRTVTLLAGPNGVLALFAVADTIKPTSIEAIVELKTLGIVPAMLTGDNQTTGDAIGKQAGIERVSGNLLPADKLDAIEALQRKYGVTAMTGDGINDAPALARADIGFAMGKLGTHTAVEAADVVVMNDDLRRLPETIRLSRRTHVVLWQNITLALGIKAVFLALAIFGGATMWMAVFADMGASLLVAFNGLRLLRNARKPTMSMWLAPPGSAGVAIENTEAQWNCGISAAFGQFTKNSTSLVRRKNCTWSSRRCHGPSKSLKKNCAQLFIRTSRSTRLTRAGKLFAEHVPRIFTALQQARDSVKAAANGFHRQLRIAYPTASRRRVCRPCWRSAGRMNLRWNFACSRCLCRNSSKDCMMICTTWDSLVPMK